MALLNNEPDRYLAELQKQMYDPNVMQRRVNHHPMISASSVSELQNSAQVKSEAQHMLESLQGRRLSIAMRLRVSENNMGFENIHTWMSGETVFVFVVQNGKAVTIEDQAGLFPSDMLITQLRLIQK